EAGESARQVPITRDHGWSCEAARAEELGRVPGVLERRQGAELAHHGFARNAERREPLGEQFGFRDPTPAPAAARDDGARAVLVKCSGGTFGTARERRLGAVRLAGTAAQDDNRIR